MAFDDKKYDRKSGDCRQRCGTAKGAFSISLDMWVIFVCLCGKCPHIIFELECSLQGIVCKTCIVRNLFADVIGSSISLQLANNCSMSWESKRRNEISMTFIVSCQTKSRNEVGKVRMVDEHAMLRTKRLIDAVGCTYRPIHTCLCS